MGAHNSNLVPHEWTVEGVKRTALVHLPELAEGEKAPLVFAWHGHFGASRRFARKVPVHVHMPGAVVVYAQGLKARTPYDMAGRGAGWQHSGADDHGGRDLKLFDVVVAHFRGITDPAQIHAVGHSNGGRFTYILAYERSDVLASAAPGSMTLIFPRRYTAGCTSEQYRPDAATVPILQWGGHRDRMVPTEEMRAQVEDLVRAKKCASGTPAPFHPECTVYVSPDHRADVAAYFYRGGHRAGRDVANVVACFFRHYPRPSTPMPPVPPAPAASAGATPAAAPAPAATAAAAAPPLHA